MDGIHFLYATPTRHRTRTTICFTILSSAQLCSSPSPFNGTDYVRCILTTWQNLAILGTFRVLINNDRTCDERERCGAGVVMTTNTKNMLINVKWTLVKWNSVRERERERECGKCSGMLCQNSVLGTLCLHKMMIGFDRPASRSKHESAEHYIMAMMAEYSISPSAWVWCVWALLRFEIVKLVHLPSWQTMRMAQTRLERNEEKFAISISPAMRDCGIG